MSPATRTLHNASAFHFCDAAVTGGVAGAVIGEKSVHKNRHRGPASKMRTTLGIVEAVEDFESEGDQPATSAEQFLCNRAQNRRSGFTGYFGATDESFAAFHKSLTQA